MVLSMGEDHIMYVADLSPPSDPEDTVQLVAACEQFLCELRPAKSEQDREGQLSSLRPPSSLSSHPDRSYPLVSVQYRIYGNELVVTL